MFKILLKEIRKKRGYKQEDVANLIKKSRSHIGKYENGYLTPNLTMFVALCEALQVTYDELKELHLEYEKLIKPQQAENLILLEFAKSEYIISLLLEGMHFKNKFMELYRQAYENNKIFVFFSFLEQIINLTDAINKTPPQKIEYIKLNDFYKSIELLKEKSKELYELSIKPLSEEEKFRADLLKKCLKEIINKIKNNFTMENNEINDLITKQNIPDHHKKKLLKVIELALKYLHHPIIDNNSKFVFDFSLFRLDSNNIKVPEDYMIYTHVKNFILDKSTNKKSFIETINGQYYSVGFKPLYDDINLIDIMADDFTTALKTKCQELGNILLEINDYITNDDFREKFFKATIDKNLELYKLIRNSFMINKGIYDINKRHKKHIEMFTKENDKLTKRNRELEQEIANLKKQLDEKENKEES